MPIRELKIDQVKVDGLVVTAQGHVKWDGRDGNLQLRAMVSEGAAVVAPTTLTVGPLTPTGHGTFRVTCTFSKPCRALARVLALTRDGARTVPLSDIIPAKGAGFASVTFDAHSEPSVGLCYVGTKHIAPGGVGHVRAFLSHPAPEKFNVSLTCTPKTLADVPSTFPVSRDMREFLIPVRARSGLGALRVTASTRFCQSTLDLLVGART